MDINTAQTIKPELKVAVIDDSFSVRTGIKLILQAFFAAHAGYDLKIYSAADGVEGIGYTLVAVPEIIILDTTLPKYSGRDLLVYLTTNQKFAGGKIRIIVITDGRNVDEVEQLHYLDKNDPDFAGRLIDYLAKAVAIHDVTFIESVRKDSAVKDANKLITRSSKAERILAKVERIYFIPWKMLVSLWWIFLQVLENFQLSWVKLIFVQYSDMNLSQQKQDDKYLFWRTYPMTFISLVIGVVFVTLFFILIVRQILTN